MILKSPQLNAKQRQATTTDEGAFAAQPALIRVWAGQRNHPDRIRCTADSPVNPVDDRTTPRGTAMTDAPTSIPPERTDVDQERVDIVETLRAHRDFLRYTVEGLTDEQAARRTTVSELCLGGLIKHVSEVEASWARFIVEGPTAMPSGFDEAGMAAHAASFRMLDGETLEALLAAYEEVAARTDELVATLPSLDVSHPLPVAPWFPPNAHRSARRVFMHIVAETAQHAGHADILREALDGQKTMG